MRASVAIRDERGEDRDAIRELVAEAFENHPHGNHREHDLIDALRAARVLTLSLVAGNDTALCGHIAFTPVLIEGKEAMWYGLGPLAVSPTFQGQGIGQTLVRTGLARLQAKGAQGCVVLGEPDYYRRFGFNHVPDLRLEGVPPEFFLARSFRGSAPKGSVAYHPLFFSLS